MAIIEVNRFTIDDALTLHIEREENVVDGVPTRSYRIKAELSGGYTLDSQYYSPRYGAFEVLTARTHEPRLEALEVCASPA